jgi:hypothetical protein
MIANPNSPSILIPVNIKPNCLYNINIKSIRIREISLTILNFFEKRKKCFKEQSNDVLDENMPSAKGNNHGRIKSTSITGISTVINNNGTVSSRLAILYLSINNLINGNKQ